MSTSAESSFIYDNLPPKPVVVSDVFMGLVVMPTSDVSDRVASRPRVVSQTLAPEAGACSLSARLSTTEPPPFCHSLPPFSAVNLRFGHASFVGKMRVVLLPLALIPRLLRGTETGASFVPLNIFV